MKILMVLTSHDQLGDTGRKTGFWLEEFAAPYFVFRDAGVQLTLASPKGAAAARSEERLTRKSDARHGAVQSGQGGADSAFAVGQASRRKGGGFRTQYSTWAGTAPCGTSRKAPIPSP